MLKKIFISIAVLLLCTSVYAQSGAFKNPENPPLNSKKWFFESSFLLALGTYSQVGITPLIGYKISPQVHSGATLSYAHSWDNSTGIVAESDIFGGSLFLRYVPIKEFFLQVEPAIYTLKDYSVGTNYENKGVPFIFVGAGVNYYVNPEFRLTFQAKVDILNNVNSPYQNEWHPFMSVGIGLGL
jgi:hypothetical protein